MKVIVVSDKVIWSTGKLLAAAALHAFVVNLLMRLIFVFPSPPSRVVLLLALNACLAILFGVPTYLIYRRPGATSPLTYGLACMIGVLFWQALSKILILEYKVPILWRPGCSLYALEASWTSICTGVCVWISSFVARRRRGRVLVQDGSTCPGCGYWLRGNTSQICPECGRGFSFAELGTTREEFLQVRSASPASQEDPAEAPEAEDV
jgi:hypothetical protein